MAEAPTEDAGENRHLTVMFCDLVDSSKLAQNLGAENYHLCLRRYEDVCAKTVERFGGYIAQLLGDGALVYFGYPQAHENDAERAVRAGLEFVRALDALNGELSAALDVVLAVRIGIHTGTVVVGAVGSGARRETLALGDTTTIAARIQTLATPNSLVVTEPTERLVEGLFVTRDLGAHELKGIAGAIRVFEVVRSVGTRSRLEAAARLSPMVGRGDELDRIARIWGDSGKGATRALLIRGEPGIGKSRLVARFREQLADEPHQWLELRCTPFMHGNALAPWTDWLRRNFELGHVESSETCRERLRQGLSFLGAPAPETADRFARLLGIPLPADSPIGAEAVELARHRVLESLELFVEALSRRDPLVMLIEDLHWADPSTLEWIRLLLERRPKSRILCLLTHRPEFEAPWSSPALEELVVERLGAGDARELACTAVPGESLSEALVETIIERADGVPLFLEELVRMVCESPTRDADGALEVPSTLQDLLMARLDQLGTAKGVAQLGAVIGRDFSHELLSEIARDDAAALQRSLDRLVQSGLLLRRGEGSDAVYSFKHALVQDTAYESLLRLRRRELHANLAEILASRVQRGVEVAPSVLGHHWRGAEEWLRAAECFDAAGRRAAATAAAEEAIGLYREGLANVARVADGIERKRRELSLCIMLGNALIAARGFQYPECLDVWLRAEALAEAVDDPNELSSARNGVAVYHVTNGNVDEAERYARLVLDVAPRGDARIIAMRGHMSLAAAYFYRGHGRRAFEHAERSISYYRPSDFWEVTYGSSIDQGVAAYGMAATTGSWLGRLDDALERANAGLRLAIKLASPLNIAMARSIVCLVCIDRGDDERLRAEVGELEDLTTEYSLPIWLGFAKLAKGFLEATAGCADGITRIFEGVSLQGETVGRSGSIRGMCLLAKAQFGVGNLDAAEAIIEAGLRLGEELRIPYYEDQLLVLKAELVLARDASATREARNLLTRARSQARERGSKLFELRAALGLARLRAAGGERAAARALLEESARGFQGDATRDGREARELLARLSRTN